MINDHERSLMYMTNNRPKILPCGTLHFTGKGSDEQLLTDTNWLQLDKYD